MAPGHPSNQGVQGGGQAVAMGAQLHGGMGGGPGTPQPGQTGAMVVGMTQGTGVPGVAGPTGAPSQHALQHLTPQPPQIFNHQQQLQASKLNFFEFYVFSRFALRDVWFLCTLQKLPAKRLRKPTLEHFGPMHNGYNQVPKLFHFAPVCLRKSATLPCLYSGF